MPPRAAAWCGIRARERKSAMTENGVAEATAQQGLRGDAVVDTVGFFCPVPIIKTAARMKEMAPGEILEVISDDQVILMDLPAWCRSTGHRYLGHRRKEGEIHLFVRKAGRSATAGEG